jgi:hypothetical protein
VEDENPLLAKRPIKDEDASVLLFNHLDEEEGGSAQGNSQRGSLSAEPREVDATEFIQKLRTELDQFAQRLSDLENKIDSLGSALDRIEVQQETMRDWFLAQSKEVRKSSGDAMRLGFEEIKSHVTLCIHQRLTEAVQAVTQSRSGELEDIRRAVQGAVQGEFQGERIRAQTSQLRSAQNAGKISTSDPRGFDAEVFYRDFIHIRNQRFASIAHDIQTAYATQLKLSIHPPFTSSVVVRGLLSCVLFKPEPDRVKSVQEEFRRRLEIELDVVRLKEITNLAQECQRLLEFTGSNPAPVCLINPAQADAFSPREHELHRDSESSGNHLWVVHPGYRLSGVKADSGVKAQVFLWRQRTS